jgi:hypothetical protein
MHTQGSLPPLNTTEKYHLNTAIVQGRIRKKKRVTKKITDEPGGIPLRSSNRTV